MKPLTKCCCCTLRLGILIGCGISILFALISIISGIPREDAPSANYATTFCEMSDATREEYAACYGGDVCDCGAMPCNFEAMLGGRSISGVVNMLINFVEVFITLYGIYGICKYNMRAIQTLFVWQMFGVNIAGLFATIIGIATGLPSSQAEWAANFGERVINNMVCNTDVASAGQNDPDDIAAFNAAQEAEGATFECTGEAEEMAGVPDDRMCQGAKLTPIFLGVLPVVFFIVVVALNILFAWCIWSLKREYMNLLKEQAKGAKPSLPVAVAHPKPTTATASLVKHGSDA